MKEDKMSNEEVAVRLTEIAINKADGYLGATVVADIYKQILEYLIDPPYTEKKKKEE